MIDPVAEELVTELRTFKVTFDASLIRLFWVQVMDLCLRMCVRLSRVGRRCNVPCLGYRTL